MLMTELNKILNLEIKQEKNYFHKVKKEELASKSAFDQPYFY